MDPMLPSDDEGEFDHSAWAERCQGRTDASPKRPPRPASSASSSEATVPATGAPCEDETQALVTTDGIRLTQRHSDGTLTPQHWAVDKMQKGGKSGYKCNVVHVSWDSRRPGWTVEKIVGGKRVAINPASSVFRLGTVDAAFVEACAKRRGVVDTPGTKATIATHRDDATGTTTLVVPWCTKATCRKTNAPLPLFAPNPRATRDQFERFVIAEAVVGDPDATAEERADALTTLGETRTDTCFDCRARDDKSNHEGPDAERAACEAMAEVIRQDLQEKGCRHCGYNGRAMQCEHVGRLGKIAGLLDVSKWVGKGGADAMWANYTEFTIPLCSFCHSLQDTHNGTRGTDSTTMEPKTQAKKQRQNNEEKRECNNEWKHARGECCHCKRKVKPGEERAFQWAHNRAMMDRFTPRRFKKYTIAALQVSRICLATFERMAWPEVRDCCQLACANCHFTKETLPELELEIGRLKAYVERMRAQGGTRVVVEAEAMSDDEDDLLPPSDEDQ